MKDSKLGDPVWIVQVMTVKYYPNCYWVDERGGSVVASMDFSTQKEALAVANRIADEARVEWDE